MVGVLIVPYCPNRGDGGTLALGGTLHLARLRPVAVDEGRSTAALVNLPSMTQEAHLPLPSGRAHAPKQTRVSFSTTARVSI